MSNKHDKLCFHDTDEVLEAEALAFQEIHGSLEDEELYELWKSIVKKWLTEEMNIFEKSSKEDCEKLWNERMSITTEDEEGNIYVCIKAFNINRLWKIAGTEP